MRVARHAYLWPAVLMTFIVSGILLAVGSALPSLDGRVPSSMLADTNGTGLGRAIEPLVREHPELSGIVALRDGRGAFATRVLMADAAERTLDVQYYIWRDDMSGTLLLEALHRAADRGVRVRVLLDDNNTAGMDTILATLDSHPLIQVRLFNPFMQRRWRALGFLTDFSRLNRRMHNKSFTVDNQATIVGGRNVGDEYFDAGDGVLFVDLDVLAIGPVVDDVSRDFDRYWASGSSYPVDRLLLGVAPGAISELAAAASLVEHDPAARAYVAALQTSPYVQALKMGQLPFEWAATHMLSDDPAKGLGQAPPESHLSDRLLQAIGAPKRELQVISPYFVPTRAGVDYLVGLARQGVAVSVLTNSLEATDVAAVHAGYAKRRKPLLEAGIVLFEMKREATGVAVVRRKFTGSSASSLHAKTFAADGTRAFVGSFNFDPRSAHLNTEMGFVIDSTFMAQGVAGAFVDEVPANAYRVRLGPEGRLQWVEQVDGEQIVHDDEPGTGVWLRAMVAAMSVLPIEWLL
ncbi:MAG: phospholipase D family protein [Lysobacter sp.]